MPQNHAGIGYRGLFASLLIACRTRARSCALRTYFKNSAAVNPRDTASPGTYCRYIYRRDSDRISAYSLFIRSLESSIYYQTDVCTCAAYIHSDQILLIDQLCDILRAHNTRGGT